MLPNLIIKCYHDNFNVYLGCNVLKCPNYTYFQGFVLCLSCSLFNILASWHWHGTLLHSSSLCFFPTLRNMWQEHNKGPHQLSFCAPAPPSLMSLWLSLKSLTVVNTMAALTLHKQRRGTRGEMCVCLHMHRGGGVLRYNTVFSSVFYCWIRVNPKQRWHCCNFPLAMKQVCTQQRG